MLIVEMFGIFHYFFKQSSKPPPPYQKKIFYAFLISSLGKAQNLCKNILWIVVFLCRLQKYNLIFLQVIDNVTFLRIWRGVFKIRGGGGGIENIPPPTPWTFMEVGKVGPLVKNKKFSKIIIFQTFHFIPTICTFMIS